jgi:hypothetical protein
MTPIPERWQELHDDACAGAHRVAEYYAAHDLQQTQLIRQLIEELGEAEQERDRLKSIWMCAYCKVKFGPFATVEEKYADINRHIAGEECPNHPVKQMELRIAEVHDEVAKRAQHVVERATRDAREQALEEAAIDCDEFAEAYSFWEPYPEGYVYSDNEGRAAALFAHGRFKVCAEKIRGRKKEDE